MHTSSMYTRGLQPVALSWRTRCREASCQIHQELYPALCLEEQQEWFQAYQVQLGWQR